MQREPNSFRVNAKALFLTYSRCPLSRQFVLDKLKSLHFNLIYIRVAKELHSDGTPHLHCLLQFEQAISITNKRKWDMQSTTSAIIQISKRQKPRQPLETTSPKAATLLSGESSRIFSSVPLKPRMLFGDPS